MQEEKTKLIIKRNDIKENKAITLVALVVTVALNCSCLAMERMLEKVNNLKI